MIDDETKEKLLKEIEKNGNVSLSCAKVGVDKATFYRWYKDKKFKKKAEGSIKRGRATNCDFAESSLMILVKQQKLEAIKYLLGHNSPIYKRNTTDYKFSYEKILPPGPKPKTLEDLLDESEEKMNSLSLEQLRKRFPQIPKVMTPQELVAEFLEKSRTEDLKKEEDILKKEEEKFDREEQWRKEHENTERIPPDYESEQQDVSTNKQTEKIIENPTTDKEKNIPQRRPRPRRHDERY